MKLFPNNRYLAGYTLVEVLLVLSVILILGGITFGTAAGVQSARMKSIAKAEIALITESLFRFHTIMEIIRLLKGLKIMQLLYLRLYWGGKFSKETLPKWSILKMFRQKE